MIRITKLTDYCFLLLGIMARGNVGETFQAKQLAEMAGLPVATTSKILKKLTQGKMLESRLGTHGGYALAHDPNSVNVAQIIEIMEGPLAITDCARHGDGKGCDRNCPSSQNWQHINRVVQTALQDISLAEMQEAPKDPNAITPRSKEQEDS